MRLVCPSCSAQYEVDDNAIPVNGRDVQCSNCSHTWMQYRPGHEPEAAAATPAEAAGEAAEPGTDESEAAAEAAPEAETAEVEPEAAEEDEAERPATEADVWGDVPDPWQESDRLRAEREEAAGAPDDAAPAEDDATPAEAEDDVSWDDSAVEDDADAANEAPRDEEAPVSTHGEGMDPELEEISAEDIIAAAIAAEDRDETRDDAPELAAGTGDDAGADDDADAETASEPEPEPEPAEEPAEAAPRRRAIDPAVLDILREEAARDAGEPIETQTEMGLQGGTAAFAPAPRRAEPDSPRRDLLPDIDEINSSLRSASDRTREDVLQEGLEGERPPGSALRRAGFRIGFVLAAVLFLMLTVAYLQPGRVVSAMPNAAPFVSGLGETVDKARVWIDGMSATVAAMISGQPGGDGG